MTFWELLAALLRRWPILLVGALVTALAGYAVVSDRGVYFTRTEIVFLAPTSSANPNALRTQSEDIIDLAGVVAKRLTGPGEVTKYASPDVMLAGLGVRDGWSLGLPDTGGQWGTNFATQQLVLDIVAPTRERVQEQQDELVGQIMTQLHELQSDKGVDPVNEVTAIVAPQTTIIHHVGGSRPRALGMTAVLGLGATIAAVTFLEYRKRRALWDRTARHGQPAGEVA
ncbi:hypothetical protein [Microbacterium trichothecenolyticum]|uniref:Capsular polysaccharide biosynthesis protein n=1 Tax=Microbacterium trichothecenolyticum TaxID=69370 RepID=A0A0M2HBD3_MICTR|nr:hypothetical protein [Microbacterium trichothecenolyticum]KJL43804.1 hypothetical protein RS82_01180 [Microbacterium trichothecenolyticum]